VSKGQWTDTLHPVKRALSIFEKSSFPVASRPGKYLLLPAEPNTEIEELLDIGVDARDVYAIEKEQVLADQLYDHYFDQVTVHWIDALSYLERASLGSYSYIHLDFCGHFKEEEVAAVISSSQALAPHSRLRVSLLRNRKVTATTQFESFLREAMGVPLLEQLARTDERLGWGEVIGNFRTSEDTTQIVAVLVLLAHFFGVNPWEYADANVGASKELPPINGRHWIYNIQHWVYSEPGAHAAMETVWFDMMELPESTSFHPGFVPAQLYQLLNTITTPTPPFTGFLPEDVTE
jgi:hypothetical protein